eukprot:UN29408
MANVLKSFESCFVQKYSDYKSHREAIHEVYHTIGEFLQGASEIIKNMTNGRLTTKRKTIIQGLLHQVYFNNLHVFDKFQKKNMDDDPLAQDHDAVILFEGYWTKR